MLKLMSKGSQRGEWGRQTHTRGSQWLTEEHTDVRICRCACVLTSCCWKSIMHTQQTKLGGWNLREQGCGWFRATSWFRRVVILEAWLCIYAFRTTTLQHEWPAFSENEDCCFTTELGAAPGQSYLCIPFHKEGHPAAAAADGDGEEYCPTGHVPGTPPCKKSPAPGGRRSDLVLLGCGALLAAVGLGCNLLNLAQPEESIKPRWEGFFHRTGGQRRSTSPPTRRLFRRESPLKPSVPSLPERGLPSSYTLLSLSSASDCNSTRSLLRSDSEELLVCRPVPQHEAVQTPVNPLVNTHLESFKRNPRQSLTPTHVPSAPSSSRGLRRTPSDGAIKKSCLPTNLEPLPEKAALENAGKVLYFQKGEPEWVAPVRQLQSFSVNGVLHWLIPDA